MSQSDQTRTILTLLHQQQQENGEQASVDGGLKKIRPSFQFDIITKRPRASTAASVSHKSGFILF